jgi:hypothetical protein
MILEHSLVPVHLDGVPVTYFTLLFVGLFAASSSEYVLSQLQCNIGTEIARSGKTHKALPPCFVIAANKEQKGGGFQKV